MPKFQTGYKLINDEDHVDLDAENVVDYRLHRASDRSKSCLIIIHNLVLAEFL